MQLKLPSWSFQQILMVAIALLIAIPFYLFSGVSQAKAFGLNPSLLGGLGNGDQLFIKFKYEMYFNDVSRSELFEFMKEIQNDDLWCNCSVTTVVRPGWGHNQIGRQWHQFYSFAGLQDEITYTRIYLQKNKHHSYIGQGLFADILADYGYSDLSNGGVKLTFNAIYKPNVPVEQAQIAGLLEALRISYETEFIPYFDSTGHVDLSQLQFFYL